MIGAEDEDELFEQQESERLRIAKLVALQRPVVVKPIGNEASKRCHPEENERLAKRVSSLHVSLGLFFCMHFSVSLIC
jgi:hypothetical protein